MVGFYLLFYNNKFTCNCQRFLEYFLKYFWAIALGQDKNFSQRKFEKNFENLLTITSLLVIIKEWKGKTTQGKPEAMKLTEARAGAEEKRKRQARREDTNNHYRQPGGCPPRTSSAFTDSW